MSVFAVPVLIYRHFTWYIEKVRTKIITTPHNQEFDYIIEIFLHKRLLSHKLKYYSALYIALKTKQLYTIMIHEHEMNLDKIVSKTINPKLNNCIPTTFLILLGTSFLFIYCVFFYIQALIIYKILSNHTLCSSSIFF